MMLNFNTYAITKIITENANNNANNNFILQMDSIFIITEPLQIYLSLVHYTTAVGSID